MDMHYYETSVGGFVPWRGNITGNISTTAGTAGAGGTAIVQGNFATQGTAGAGGTAIVQGAFSSGATLATGGTAIVQFSSGSATQVIAGIISGTVAILGSGAAGTALISGAVSVPATVVVAGTVAILGSGAAGTALISGTVNANAHTVFVSGTAIIAGTVALLGSGAAGTSLISGAVSVPATVVVAGTVAILGSGAAGTALVSGTVSVGNTATVNLSSATLAVIASSGTPYVHVMQPQIQSVASTANAKEFVSNTTGFNTLVFKIGGISSPSASACVISWSTTAADQSNVKTAIDSITTTASGKWDAPDGAAVLNTIVLNCIPGEAYEVGIDVATPVKTFGAEVTSQVAGMKLIVTGLQAS